MKLANQIMETSKNIEENDKVAQAVAISKSTDGPAKELQKALKVAQKQGFKKTSKLIEKALDALGKIAGTVSGEV